VRILGFDWDDLNERKIALHEFEPDDVEWLFDRGQPAYFQHPSDRRRTLALGFVPDRRFVLVVFEHDRETRWIRVVTAYEPTSEIWWNRYKKAKGSLESE